MRKYKCKVRIISDWEVVVPAKNKEAAEEGAPNLCICGWGNLIARHVEMLDIKHIPKE